MPAEVDCFALAAYTVRMQETAYGQALVRVGKPAVRVRVTRTKNPTLASVSEFVRVLGQVLSE